MGRAVFNGFRKLLCSSKLYITAVILFSCIYTGFGGINGYLMRQGQTVQAGELFVFGMDSWIPQLIITVAFLILVNDIPFGKSGAQLQLIRSSRSRWLIVDGKQLGKDVDFAPDAGIIIETPCFLPYLSGFQNLKELASIRNIISKEEIAEAMEQVKLDPSSRKHVGKYSLGMRQRLGIAQAIMERPRYLILDEPMNGLDTQGMEDVRELLQKQKETGVTVILASHSMEDIRLLCDTVHRIQDASLIPCTTEFS